MRALSRRLKKLDHQFGLSHKHPRLIIIVTGYRTLAIDDDACPFCNNPACNKMADYHKAGLLHVQDGRVLLCRKKHTTSLLILPGGTLEKGETAEECLRRECREELGEVEVSNLHYLGEYESPAAGQDGKTVKIELYAGELEGTPAAHSEIQDLVWFGPRDDATLLAPSLRNVIFPHVRHLLSYVIPNRTYR